MFLFIRFMLKNVMFYVCNCFSYSVFVTFVIREMLAVIIFSYMVFLMLFLFMGMTMYIVCWYYLKDCFNNMVYVNLIVVNGVRLSKLSLKDICFFWFLGVSKVVLGLSFFCVEFLYIFIEDY